MDPTYPADLHHLRVVHPSVKLTLEHLPPTPFLMDALRSQMSLLGHLEPETSKDPFLVIDRVLSSLASMLLYWDHFQTKHRRIELATQSQTLPGHILELILQRVPTPEESACIQASMILYAEHDFNASTFTVRTIASTLSDYYSAICGGIGALRGPLHGGANEAALELILSFATPEAAEKGIMEKLKHKQLVMGFGHRVYTTRDPRSKIIEKWAEKLAQTPEQKQQLAIARQMDATMKREKNSSPISIFIARLPTILWAFLTSSSPLFLSSLVLPVGPRIYSSKENTTKSSVL